MIAAPYQKIYTASKTRHAKYWQQLRKQGVNIISTWIDEAEKGQTKDIPELARRCISEIKACDFVLLYIEGDDQVHGALIEVGAGLAFGKPIRLVARQYRISVFDFHPLVERFMCVAEALELGPCGAMPPK